MNHDKANMFYKSMMDTSTDGMAIVAIDGKVIDINSALDKITGTSRSEFIGSAIENYFTEPSIATWLLKKTYDEGFIKDTLLEIKHVEGFTTPVMFDAKIYRNEFGEISGIFVIIKNITDHLIAQEEIRKRENFVLIAENSTDLIVRISSENKILYVSPACAAISGYLPSEVLGKDFTKFIYHEDIEKINRITTKMILEKKDTYSNDIRLYKKDGTIIWIGCNGRITLDKNTGIVTEMLAIIRDITEVKNAEEKMQQAIAALEYQRMFTDEMLENMNAGVVACDSQGRVVLINRAVREWYGADANCDAANCEMEYNLYYADGFTKVEDNAAPLFRAFMGETINNSEYVIAPDGKRKINVLCNAAPIMDKSGVRLGAVTVMQNNTNEMENLNEIQYLSYHDVLTGLYNRAYFEKALFQLDNRTDKTVSIIMGDVNGLKLINDVFGHTEGDMLLIAISKIIRKCCRKTDIVARYGGDEFCILLDGSDHKTAMKICKNIYKACEEYDSEIAKGNARLSISLGCATKDKPNKSLSHCISKAEDLMYKRKLLESKNHHRSTISSIRTTLYNKSHETEEHVERLITLSVGVGRRLGLLTETLNELQLFAMLHDIGKIGIADYILLKKDKLTHDEMLEIRRHPEIGYRIVKSSPELSHIAEYILTHHERVDGKGYPQGLVGDSIPLLSRIFAVVDAYDRMIEGKAKKKKMTEQKAVLELEKNAGKQFDGEIVSVFIEFLKHSE